MLLSDQEIKKLAKEEVSEDEIKELTEDLQKLTDKYIKDVEKLMEEKNIKQGDYSNIAKIIMSSNNNIKTDMSSFSINDLKY